MIDLLNVTKKYGKKVIFKDLNLKIDSNGVYLIKGNNGIGKSTLLNIIAGFSKVKGKVSNDYKESIGYVSQNSYLIEELTVKEHIEMFDIDLKILSKYALEDKIDAKCKTLSSGERQRVALIIALYSDNQLILLDEVLSNVNLELAKIIVKEIFKLREKKIIIMISHNHMVLLKNVDGIIEIKDNRVELKKLKNKSLQKNKVNKRKKVRLKLRKSDNKLVVSLTIIYLFFTIIWVCGSLISNIVSHDIKNSVDYNKFYLKECEYIGNNEFKISKCSNPSIEKLESNKINYGLNYDYFLMSAYDNENLSIMYNRDIGLKEGRYPDKFNEVLASDKFFIGQQIETRVNLIVAQDNIDIYNQTVFFEVVGIYNDLVLYDDQNIYIDYYLMEEYLKKEVLVNNDISLYDYFKSLEINNYKYLTFSNLETDNLLLEGKSYSFYQSILKLIENIDILLNYIELIVIVFSIYHLYKIFKVRIIKIEKEIAFLLANSFSRRSIIHVYFNRDFLNLLCINFLCVFITFLFTKDSLHIIKAMTLFVMFFLLSYTLIISLFSRKNISRIMLEEIW